jgi:hypothetical protein
MAEESNNVSIRDNETGRFSLLIASLSIARIKVSIDKYAEPHLVLFSRRRRHFKFWNTLSKLYDPRIEDINELSFFRSLQIRRC